MSEPTCEGVFAIHKPGGISSAQVIRDAQDHFNPSKMFQPWVEGQKAKLLAESHNQRQKRRSWKSKQALKVKIGHGGTLDPMATGVLILGVGNGTKELNSFLNCTKSYEAVVLFGAATDSYDAVGNVVAQKPYDHITKEKVEEALGKFRGKIMQRPPIFSALRIDGKRLYEYAREGKELPREIVERPVEVEQLEMLEWMPGGTHDWQWPATEVDVEGKAAAKKLLNLADSSDETTREDAEPSAKRQRTGESSKSDASEPEATTLPDAPVGKDEQQQQPDVAEVTKEQTPCPAPACRIRMTVTSGFYVRSLCHDLGVAVDSLALMSSLVRTRQGDFELGGNNVLEYDDLAKGEHVWGPKTEAMLADWQAKHPSVQQHLQGPSKPRAAALPSGKQQATKPAEQRARRNSSSGSE